MKRFGSAVLVLLVTACGAAPQSTPVFEGEPYGEELTLTTLTPIPDIVAAPQQFVGSGC
jgi:hypothetical protein